MSRRRLPIGIQTFRTLRERDCYCVDKTAFFCQRIHLIGVEFSRETRNVTVGHRL